MSKPLVSIVTIVYNGEKHLEQTIQSVLNQTYPHIEYIIIDGGSKDKTVSIIKKYEEKLGYWISKKDKGISDAFNRGIGVAKGEIIGLINSDDWYEPDTVEKVVNSIGNSDIAYGNLQYWKNGSKDMYVEGDHEFLLNEMSVNHPTVFVKRHCYSKFMFNLNYKYAMDFDLMLRFKLEGFTFNYIPSILANMRWEGVSDQQWYKACKEVLQIKNRLLPERRILNELYFHKQVGSIKMGRLLNRMHLNKVVRLYRKWFSPIKKTYS